MRAIPLLLRAALPSGVRSMPRCFAMAAETGVISKSPTSSPSSLLVLFSKIQECAYFELMQKIVLNQ